MLPIESKAEPMWPGTFRRRVTEVKAWRVTHANLKHIADWVGGSTHTWGSSVVLPGDIVANVGDWVLLANQTFLVVDDARFTRDFYEVTA